MTCPLLHCHLQKVKQSELLLCHIRCLCGQHYCGLSAWDEIASGFQSCRPFRSGACNTCCCYNKRCTWSKVHLFFLPHFRLPSVLTLLSLFANIAIKKKEEKKVSHFEYLYIVFVRFNLIRIAFCSALNWPQSKRAFVLTMSIAHHANDRDQMLPQRVSIVIRNDARALPFELSVRVCRCHYVWLTNKLRFFEPSRCDVRTFLQTSQLFTLTISLSLVIQSYPTLWQYFCFYHNRWVK